MSYHISQSPHVAPLLDHITEFLIARAKLRYAIWVMVSQYAMHPVLGVEKAGKIMPRIQYRPSHQLTGLEQEAVPISGPFRDKFGNAYVDRPGFVLRWAQLDIRTVGGKKAKLANGTNEGFTSDKTANQISKRSINAFILKGVPDGPERDSAQRSFKLLFDHINGTYEKYKALGYKMRAWKYSFHSMVESAEGKMTDISRESLRQVTID